MFSLSETRKQESKSQETKLSSSATMACVLHLLPLLLLSTITIISAAPITFDPAIQTDRQLHNVIEALIGAGDFGNWASVLSVTDPSSFPITATLFIPNDNSVTEPSLFNPSTFAYHIVPQQLSFLDLLSFGIGSRLPTLLPEKSILVTNNTRLNYSIDGVRITRPDLYINGAVAVHGIGSVLNDSVYGNGFFQYPNPIPSSPSSSPSSSPLPSSPPPPPPPLPDAADHLPEPSSFGNMNANIFHSDAACLGVEFLVTLSVVLATLGVVL